MRGKGLCFWELSSNAVHRCVVRHHGLQPEDTSNAPGPLVKVAKMLKVRIIHSSPFDPLMVIVLAKRE